MAYQAIYRDILTYRNFPEGLLVGSGARMDALRTLLPRLSKTSPRSK